MSKSFAIHNVMLQGNVIGGFSKCHKINIDATAGAASYSGGLKDTLLEWWTSEAKESGTLPTIGYPKGGK